MSSALTRYNVYEEPDYCIIKNKTKEEQGLLTAILPISTFVAIIRIV